MKKRKFGTVKSANIHLQSPGGKSKKQHGGTITWARSPDEKKRIAAHELLEAEGEIDGLETMLSEIITKAKKVSPAKLIPQNVAELSSTEKMQEASLDNKNNSLLKSWLDVQVHSSIANIATNPSDITDRSSIFSQNNEDIKSQNNNRLLTLLNEIETNVKASIISSTKIPAKNNQNHALIQARRKAAKELRRKKIAEANAKRNGTNKNVSKVKFQPNKIHFNVYQPLNTANNDNSNNKCQNSFKNTSASKALNDQNMFNHSSIISKQSNLSGGNNASHVLNQSKSFHKQMPPPSNSISGNNQKQTKHFSAENSIHKSHKIPSFPNTNVNNSMPNIRNSGIKTCLNNNNNNNNMQLMTSRIKQKVNSTQSINPQQSFNINHSNQKSNGNQVHTAIQSTGRMQSNNVYSKSNANASIKVPHPKLQKYAGSKQVNVSTLPNQLPSMYANQPSNFQKPKENHQKPLPVFADDDDAAFLAAMCAATEKAEKQLYDNKKVGMDPKKNQNCNTAATLAPTSASASRGTAFATLKILEIANASSDINCPEMLLSCQFKNKEKRIIQCALKGSWASMPLRIGDNINIIPTVNDPNFFLSETLVVCDNNNFVVLYPDYLVPPTRVVEALGCLRRAVLSDQISNILGANKACVFGNLKHALFEVALMEWQSLSSKFKHLNVKRLIPYGFDSDFLNQSILQITKKAKVVEELFAINCDESDAISELQNTIPTLQDWAQRHLVKDAKKDNIVDYGAGNSYNTIITSIVASEEKIWSSIWGLKGQIDVTVESKVNQLNSHPVISPLEVKTGKQLRSEHHAQVVLYALLTNDRYFRMATVGVGDYKDIAGLLVHLLPGKQVEENISYQRDTSRVKTKGVSNRHDELRELIMLRNRFAAAASPIWFRGKNTNLQIKSLNSNVDKIENDDLEARNDEFTLPPVIGNHLDECVRCFQKEICMLNHVAANGNYKNAGIPEKDFMDLIGHLNPNHLNYFNHWNHLIDLEATSISSYQREIWSMTGGDRENLGRCIAKMKLLSSKRNDDQTYEYIFKRDDEIQLSTLQMDIGDFVAVSISNAHHAVINGTLKSVTINKVIVNSKQLIRFACSSIESTVENAIQLNNFKPDQLFRIDKDEYVGGLRLCKDNLVSLFVSDRRELYSADSTMLRKLVVDLQHPTYVDDNDIVGRRRLRDNINIPSHFFNGSWSLNNLRKSIVFESSPHQNFNDGVSELAKEYKMLTNDQKKAVSTVLAANDYVCIQGMPGTGKSTTIAFIVRLLKALGQSVIVTGYTHSAVDNLLMKLLESDEDFLRLGYSGQVHPLIRGHTIDGKHANNLNVKTYENYSNDPALILGTTCLGIKHPLLHRRKFNYCIVDEAGQLTQPVCLGPMRCADVFILIGDYHQLPPLVKSQRAKEKGMDVSLFSRLCEAHPNHVVRLTKQFRMNENIMLLANKLVYENTLECGSAAIAARLLEMPSYPQNVPKPSVNIQHSWLSETLHPKLSVVFLNTDGMSNSYEQRNINSLPTSEAFSQRDRGDRGLLVNQVESDLVLLLVKTLVDCGVEKTDIGVISPYRSQLKVLTDRLHDYLPQLEVQTVDKFQGRDKLCIIISLVRSNESKKVGTLLNDWRRINVAFTRAKCKLIIIGSQSTLQASPVCLKFLNFVQEKSWTRNLPVNGLSMYPAEAINAFKVHLPSSGPSSHVTNSHIMNRQGVNPVLRDIQHEINSQHDQPNKTFKPIATKPVNQLDW